MRGRQVLQLGMGEQGVAAWCVLRMGRKEEDIDTNRSAVIENDRATRENVVTRRYLN